MIYDIAIDIKTISKSYNLYGRPADRVKELLHPFKKSYHHKFHALKNINLQIRKGEFFGIIGRNGSGKSTLLQIICGVLSPTAGTISVNGRISALLELGAGFNPELTGRQNVYLNGAILGFSHEEMNGYFAGIHDFAEIGEFIDQPVKTYSSGMFVRLAFAVQSCVQPDILVIDEALAVGDIFFRQKCYRRLEKLRNSGCTVIFVSHAMNDVEQFCGRALLLDKGTNIFLGSASEAVKRYYLLEQKERMGSQVIIEENPSKVDVLPSSVEISETDFFWPSPQAFLDISHVSQVTNGWATCTGVAVCDSKGETCYSFEQGDTASFFYEFKIDKDIEVPTGGVEIINDKGIIVHGKSTLEYGSKVPNRLKQGEKLRFRQDIALEIAPGEYTFNIGMATMKFADYQQRGSLSHNDLHSKIIVICNLVSIGYFSIIMRREKIPVQLLHYGIANLPGDSKIKIIKHNST